jgi:hypothetical protein
MPVPLLQFFRIQNSSHTVRTERQWHQSHRLRERKGDEGSFALQFRGEFSAFVGSTDILKCHLYRLVIEPREYFRAA